MTETQFNLTADKLSERLEILLKRMEGYMRELEPHERKWNKEHETHSVNYRSFFNPWGFFLQKPRKEYNQITRLLRSVNLQIDIIGPGVPRNTMVIQLSISDMDIIHRWMHLYPTAQSTIDYITKIFIDEKS